MAFLPERNFFEENLTTAYDLSLGISNFNSSDISKFTSFSLQFTCTDVIGSNTFCIEQSLDQLNWSLLSDDSEIPTGDSNFFIDKQFFSGKYLRICLVTTNSGLLTINLLAKR